MSRRRGAGRRAERGLRRDDVARPGPRDRAAHTEERVADEPDQDHDGDHNQDDPQDPAPGHLHTALLVVVDVRRRHRDSMQPRIGQVKVGRAAVNPMQEASNPALTNLRNVRARRWTLFRSRPNDRAGDPALNVERRRRCPILHV
jgi:hypothetical protein